MDIALLLPPEQAKTKRMLAMSPLCSELGSLLGKAVDLVNLRVVSTVFQKEIIAADRRIHTGNAYAADEFEIMVLSFFQKLSQERAEILAEGLRGGRFCANHLIKTRKLGLPQDSKDSFSLLQRAGLIDESMAAALRAMVGFRNILLHQYQKLDLGIMVEVIERRLDDLLAFAKIALAASD